MQGTDRALLSEVSSAEYAFLESLKISKLPFTNFFACYQALIERVVAVKCAKHSGVFSIEKPDDSSQKTSSIVRLARLRELEQLDAQRSEILNKLKKAKQIGRQVYLNTKIKYIDEKISELKSNF